MDLVKSLVGIIGVPIILAIVQIIKPFVKDDRFYALIAVAMGLLINVGAAWVIANGALTPAIIGIGAINGLFAGLSAAGVYSTGQAIQKGGS
jgi:hypothetical protein